MLRRSTSAPLPMPGRWLARLVPWRRPVAAPSTLNRIEVRPPARWGESDSVWQSLWQWISSDAADTEQAPPQRLDHARRDFCTALNGLLTRDAQDLRQRGAHARSLRELWHLRTELYGLIARHHSQGEAERRLAAINHHFPVGVRPAARTATLDQHEDHVA